MTFVRPAPAETRRVETVTRTGLRALERLVAADPLVNAVVAARIAAHRRLEPAALGGTVFGVRTPGTRALSGALFSGGNLIPLGGERADWPLLAEQVAHRPKVCTSLVGRADAVAALWQHLEPGWGAPRTVRETQPLLALRYRDDTVRADPRVRVMRPDDYARYLPAAAAMFTEELGVSPLTGRSAAGYRGRVHGLIARRHAFGIVDDDGSIAFKADVGALTPQTAQLQGVWVRPDLRGRGLGTAALAGVLDLVLGVAPSVSLYVNDFNTAARRVYARLGMRQVATLSTVLL